jgi:uncharacterized protein (UPF0248 family)
MDLRLLHVKQEKLPEVVFQQNVENFLEGESYSSEEEASILAPEPEQDVEAPVQVDSNAAAAAAAPADAPQRKKKAKKTAEPEVEKKRMRTSWDVYNRLKWDPSLREHNWVVGYEDRFDGVLETTLEEFTLAEIPWHRVRYYKKNGEVVWDRRTRVDKVFSPGE